MGQPRVELKAGLPPNDGRQPQPWLSFTSGLAGRATNSRSVRQGRELLFEGRVLPIDILEKVHLAVLHDYGSQVHRYQLNRAFDLYGNRFRALYRCKYAIRRPAGLIAQNPLRQVFWPFKANTAVTEIAARRGE